MMRALLALLVLGALAAPAMAGPCGHRTYRHGYRHYHPRPHYGHRYSDSRHHYPRHRYVRTYYPRHYRYGHRHRYGYRYRCHTGAHYSNRYRYRTYPRISIVPFYTRYTTVLTLDDEAFDGATAPAYDGIPQARTRPVGDRFLVSE